MPADMRETDRLLPGCTAVVLCSQRHRLSVGVWSMVGLASFCSFAISAEPDDARFFREKIEPVLKAQCFGCHSQQADEVKGGLRLDSKAALLRGGDTGPAVVVGKAGESLLIQALRHEGTGRASATRRAGRLFCSHHRGRRDTPQ